MRDGVALGNPEMDLAPAQDAYDTSAHRWFLAALGAIVLGSAGHLLIKLGLSLSAGQPAADLVVRVAHYLRQPWVMGGLAIYAAGTALWIYAVSHRHISFLYPLTALTYVIVAMGGKFMFGELISTGRWLGIGVVVVGVAMLQLSDGGAKP
jgi:drug/metabolite transporter (DMT)-like permease